MRYYLHTFYEWLADILTETSKLFGVGILVILGTIIPIWILVKIFGV